MKTKNDYYEAIQDVLVTLMRSEIDATETDCSDKNILGTASHVRRLLELHDWLSMNMDGNI